MQFLIGAVLGVAVGLLAGIIGTSWYYEHQILAGYTQPPAITSGGIVSPRNSPGSSENPSAGTQPPPR
jgi:hypothetical protein